MDDHCTRECALFLRAKSYLTRRLDEFDLVANCLKPGEMEKWLDDVDTLIPPSREKSRAVLLTALLKGGNIRIVMKVCQPCNKAVDETDIIMDDRVRERRMLANERRIQAQVIAPLVIRGHLLSVLPHLFVTDCEIDNQNPLWTLARLRTLFSGSHTSRLFRVSFMLHSNHLRLSDITRKSTLSLKTVLVNESSQVQRMVGIQIMFLLQTLRECCIQHCDGHGGNWVVSYSDRPTWICMRVSASVGMLMFTRHVVRLIDWDQARKYPSPFDIDNTDELSPLASDIFNPGLLHTGDGPRMGYHSDELSFADIYGLQHDVFDPLADLFSLMPLLSTATNSRLVEFLCRNSNWHPENLNAVAPDYEAQLMQRSSDDNKSFPLHNAVYSPVRHWIPCLPLPRTHRADAHPRLLNVQQGGDVIECGVSIPVRIPPQTYHTPLEALLQFAEFEPYRFSYSDGNIQEAAQKHASLMHPRHPFTEWCTPLSLPHTSTAFEVNIPEVTFDREYTDTHRVKVGAIPYVDELNQQHIEYVSSVALLRLERSQRKRKRGSTLG